MKKLVIYVDNIKCYEGVPKSQKQIINSYNSSNIKLYDDYTNYEHAYNYVTDEYDLIRVRTIVFISNLIRG